jgi:hypothetical protein
MNIFVLDLDVKKCAKYHCDKHLVKMITEHNQILGSVSYTKRGVNHKREITPKFIEKHFQNFPRQLDGKPHPYGIGYQNHPCTKWAAESTDNYIWLCELTLEMCKEYTKRYKRTHAGEAICKWYLNNMPILPTQKMTPFAQAIADDVKNEDVVKAYRDYYKKYKSHIVKWAHSEQPSWW